MIRTIANVIRGEGLASAARRTRERISEALRGTFANDAHASLLNVSATPVVARLGGVPIQLLHRLRIERTLRKVALLHAGAASFEQRVRASGATAIHLEGTSEVPLDAVLRLLDDGMRIAVSVHDFTLFDGGERAARLLREAAGVIFPSAFLRARYRERFGDFAADVIEPGVPPVHPPLRYQRRAIAFAGSVQRHKGAHLLADLIGDAHCHVFGGGDADLLRALRRRGNCTIHGYYRAGTLPSLLARHGVGLVVLPSIVEESYSLVLSEAWQAGAVAAAFDRGAIAERIRAHGGGRVADDLREVVRGWLRGEWTATAPSRIASSEEAARAHIELYRRAGLL